jgi:glutamate formiminotransferase
MVRGPGRRFVSSTARRILSKAKGLARSELKTLVACNIYIAAGGDTLLHRPILVSAVRRAQDLIRQEVSLKSTVSIGKDGSESTAVKEKNPWVENALVGAVVTAYTDPVYNRSSVYLAGTASVIAKVASDLAVTTVQELRTLPNNDPATVSYNAVAQHPCIGLIDHVRVMPLFEVGQSLEFNVEEGDGWAPAGRAARHIARAMREQLGMTVFLYGMAHPEFRTLAEVREKHRKKFKRISGILPPKHSGAGKPRPEAVTVGAPQEFIDCHHILLNQECGKRRAKFLTRLVRESDRGLPNVEALTLPYSEGRFEIACNLLRPGESTQPRDTRAAIERYLKKCKTQPLVEKCYYVGTTVSQCVETLVRVSKSDDHRRLHDNQVVEEFQSSFQ